MSLPAARLGDICSGHPVCFPSRPNIQGSPDVFINGIPAHRQGDTWAIHCKQCGKDRPCHGSILAKGSPTVYTNGRQQGRVTDPVACGSFILTGSPNVFVGGNSISSPIISSIEPDALPSDDSSSNNDPSKGATVPYYGSPGGGGSPYSGGGFVSNGSKYSRFTDSPIPPPKDGGDMSLGSLSAQYESGGRGSESIGYDSTGGWSYGTYQIATKTGTMNNYMNYLQQNNPQLYDELQSAGGVNGASSGSPEFKNKWQQLSSNPEFVKSQHDFIQSTHYDPLVENLNNSGIDLSNRSPVVNDVVWSVGVQHGPNSNVIQNALKGRDVSSMSDQEVINAIYDERSTTNSNGKLKYFSNSTPAVQRSVRNRFNNERNQALSSV